MAGPQLLEPSPADCQDAPSREAGPEPGTLMWYVGVPGGVDGMCMGSEAHIALRALGSCVDTQLILASVLPSFCAPVFESDRGLRVPWSLTVQGEQLLKALPRVWRVRAVPAEPWSFRTPLPSWHLLDTSWPLVAGGWPVSAPCARLPAGPVWLGQRRR